MCKKIHIPCVCGFFVVPLWPLALRLIIPLTEPTEIEENINHTEKHTQLRNYERNYFSRRKCNEVVSFE